MQAAANPISHVRTDPLFRPNWGHPHWWHRKGMKMMYRATTTGPIVYIEGSAAFLEIHPCEDDLWDLRWKVIFSRNEQASGNVIVSTEKLECAFGLKDNFTNPDDIAHSNSFVTEYGGTIGYQGRFIRWQEFLTIPAPGMGHDGIAAVSIDIDNRGIKDAIRSAIDQRFSHS